VVLSLDASLPPKPFDSHNDTTHRNGVRESRAVGHSYYTKQVSNNDIDWGEYNAYNQEGEKDHGSARRQSETGRRHD
jgi:hypothetical protein